MGGSKLLRPQTVSSAVYFYVKTVSSAVYFYISRRERGGAAEVWGGLFCPASDILS
jgi:hypothetical protein